MWELLIAFVLGVIACQIFEALEPAVQAKATAEEASIYGWIVQAIHTIWAKIFGKKKAASTASTTPAAKS